MSIKLPDGREIEVDPEGFMLQPELWTDNCAGGGGIGHSGGDGGTSAWDQTPVARPAAGFAGGGRAVITDTGGIDVPEFRDYARERNSGQ